MMFYGYNFLLILFSQYFGLSPLFSISKLDFYEIVSIKVVNAITLSAYYLSKNISIASNNKLLCF